MIKKDELIPGRWYDSHPGEGRGWIALWLGDRFVGPRGALPHDDFIPNGLYVPLCDQIAVEDLNAGVLKREKGALSAGEAFFVLMS